LGKILFIGNNNKLNNVYILNLNIFIGRDIILRQNANEAKEIVQNNPDLELIVSYATIQTSSELEQTALQIHKFIKEKDFEIPMILIGHEKILKKFVISLDEDIAVTILVKTVAEKIRVKERPLSKNNITGYSYYAIPTQYFLFTNKVICEVFIRIKENDNKYQYVTRLAPNNIYSKSEIEKYIVKGLAYFYIRGGDRLKFVNYITNGVEKKLDDPRLQDKEKLELTSSTMDIVSDELSTRGMSEETIFIAQTGMKTIRKSVENVSSLNKLLNLLLNSKSSYRYRHSLLITYISFHISSNMEWGSPQQREQLAFAAYFHDIALTSDKLAKIHSEKELLKKTGAGTKDFYRAQAHAQIAAEFLKKFPRVPLGVDDIIKQHHGASNGIGFVKTFSNNLFPLAIFFIVAEGYVDILLEHKGKIKSSDITKILFDKYSKFIYKKAITTLQNVEF